MRIGKGGGENNWGRVKNALRSKNALRPTLYGLPKDHKGLIPGREEEGPTPRGVCAATELNNHHVLLFIQVRQQID